MNVQELLTGSWETVGKPSNLMPGTWDTNGNLSFDTSLSLVSTVSLLGLVNRGYKRVCGYKFPRGTLLRFNELEKSVYFSSKVIEGTAVGGASTYVTLDSNADIYLAGSANDDVLNGWIVELTGGTGDGQVRLITDYDGTSRQASVHVDWSTTPDATSEYKVYKNFFKVLDIGSTEASYGIAVDKGRYLASTSILDLKRERALNKKVRDEKFATLITDSGDPYVWWEQGQRVYFDRAVDESRWFEFRYMETPESLTTYDQEPQIPEIWHEAIILWVRWYYFLGERETEAAYGARRDFENHMETTKMQWDFRMEDTDGHVEVRLK